MEHALPRTWSLRMTSENHGTVGPAGCTFSHAPEKHECVLVVEVPAAANKAAEEGGLPELLQEISNLAAVGMCHGLTADDYCSQIVEKIAADRASRQVANKAEVGPWYMTRLHDMGTVYKADGTMVAQTYAACAKAFMDAHNASLATPPATTGASTVLTDERITDTALQHSAGSMDGHWCFKHKNLLDFAREVAAQAGQVAVPEDAIWNAITRLERTDSTQEERFAAADSLRAIAAPSPAKESK